MYAPGKFRQISFSVGFQSALSCTTWL